MAKRMKKEQASLSVSYMDVFFLLLAGCILSLGIYLFTEETGTAPVKEYQVEASAFYREELLHAIPTAGDALFDGEGNRIGELLTVQMYETNGRTEALLTFTLLGEAPQPGDRFQVETVSSLAEAEILSITETEGREAA